MDLTKEERAELEQLARHAELPYIRRKALVLLSLADGRAIIEVAGVLRVTRQTVYNWQRRYMEKGVVGLSVQAGRGRKPRINLEELERYIRQSPSAFGVNRTRWTLASLALVVPSARGCTPFGVQKALRRRGIHYKRGQPWVHSPDPNYEVKKKPLTRR